MKVRIGIDVGGTFTKAAVIDCASGELLQKAVVPTTYDPERGVAIGIMEAFRRALLESGTSAEEVEAVVLSTTQAVNALLEGDTAPVGIIGIGRRPFERDVRRRTRLGAVKLTPTQELTVHHRYLALEDLQEKGPDDTLRALMDEGAQAIVASAAYSVEDPSAEKSVMAGAARLGIPATSGHEMTGLYGLEVRTFTAAINASILPRMMAVLTWVRDSVRDSGVMAPIMVMHGDLDVISINDALQHPAPTILAGPAASVAGAALFHRLVDGILMEVGGTSTNIGAVRHGRPRMKYVTIMNHPTCLRSVDVRVAGVGGGSMVRVHGRKISDVGPRSAHMAGLPYACFASPRDLTGLRLVLVATRPGEPAMYAAVENERGQRFAITVSDAANALGEVPEGDYARGSREAARLALAPLAAELGMTADEAAAAILRQAVRKLIAPLRYLGQDYQLERATLVGLGGAASVLVPAAARELGVDHVIVPHADVISSIGAAITPVGVELERSVTDDDPRAFGQLIREARGKAAEAGASSESVWVTVESIPERSAVRIRAVGNLPGSHAPAWRQGNGAAADAIGQAFPDRAGQPELIFETGFFRVFRTELKSGVGPFRKRRSAITVVDIEGGVRFAATGSSWRLCEAGEAPQSLAALARGQPAGVLSAPTQLAALVDSTLIVLPRARARLLESVVRDLVAAMGGIQVGFFAGTSRVAA